MARPRKERIAAQLSTTAVEHRELWQPVATALRDAILSGAIPPGSNLVEVDLADRFTVSRGPIRQALAELAREGLVVDLARRGTIVSTLTVADLNEVYAVRDGLEGVAARRAVEWATDDELAEIAALADEQERWSGPGDYEKGLLTHQAFHRGIVALSRNARLISIYEQMLAQTQLLLRASAVSNPSVVLAPGRSAHRAIVDALQARDGARAQRAVTRHYLHAAGRLMNRLAEDAVPAGDSAAGNGASRASGVAPTIGTASTNGSPRSAAPA